VGAFNVGCIYPAGDIDVDPGLQSVVDAWLAKANLSGQQLLAFKTYLDTYIQGEFGGAISQLALWYDEDSSLRGGDKLVIGGYQNLIGSLASGLRVRLNNEVKEIAYSKSKGVSVTVSTKESGHVAINAARAVVTLPIGVLKAGKVKFVPPLPAVNRDAIGSMGNGLLDKTILVFPFVFWETSYEFFERIAPSESPGSWEEWLSLYPVSDSLPILIGFNAAIYAASLEKKSDAQIVAEAMAVLRKIWPSAPAPLEYKITRWKADPYALGAYSFTTPSMEYAPVHRDVGRPVGGGLVQFAGEHTAMKYPATVHGAYLSGITAACNILRDIGKTC